MCIQINSKLYADYLKIIAAKIRAKKEYITALDAATGDGDHWINMNKGFDTLAGMADDLEKMPLSDMFKSIGMTIMDVVGGSSGVLYGSAYLGMAEAVKGLSSVDSKGLDAMLTAMLTAIMKRGNSQPGQKTMIDTIYVAEKAYKEALDSGRSEKEMMAALRKGAQEGADSTMEMPAFRGRASYQANKGVGNLDPGAVTMQYQLEILADYIEATL